MKVRVSYQDGLFNWIIQEKKRDGWKKIEAFASLILAEEFIEDLKKFRNVELIKD